MQLLVTGVMISSTACTKMGRGDLRLLDVVMEVNQQPVCNLQKSFDDATQDLRSVSLVLDRSISLPSISELISGGQSRIHVQGSFQTIPFQCVWGQLDKTIAIGYRSIYFSDLIYRWFAVTIVTPQCFPVSKPT